MELKQRCVFPDNQTGEAPFLVVCASVGDLGSDRWNINLCSQGWGRYGRPGRHGPEFDCRPGETAAPDCEDRGRSEKSDEIWSQS